MIRLNQVLSETPMGSFRRVSEIRGHTEDVRSSNPPNLRWLWHWPPWKITMLCLAGQGCPVVSYRHHHMLERQNSQGTGTFCSFVCSCRAIPGEPCWPSVLEKRRSGTGMMRLANMSWRGHWLVTWITSMPWRTFHLHWTLRMQGPSPQVRADDERLK